MYPQTGRDLCSLVWLGLLPPVYNHPPRSELVPSTEQDTRQVVLQLLSTELDALDEFQFFCFVLFLIPFLNLGVY